MNQVEVSFIVPTLNEELHIGKMLDSIAQNFPEELSYEVIVVDNGSNDRTLDIAQQMGAICFQATGGTISSLRNLGVSKAKADIFVFLDADVYLQEGWGKQIGPVIEKLHSRPNIVTGSFYGVSDENNWIERIWFAPRTTQREVNYINSGHLIAHRWLFEQVGGFNTNLETGEDYDFGVRARNMGAFLENDPHLKVVHAGYPKNVKTFFRRERWHGRGDCKSFSTLLSSRPSLLCLTNLIVIMTCITGLIWSGNLAMFVCVYVMFLGIISFAAAFHRSQFRSNPDLLGVVFLYVVYFTARTISIIDVAVLQMTRRTSPSIC